MNLTNINTDINDPTLLHSFSRPNIATINSDFNGAFSDFQTMNQSTSPDLISWLNGDSTDYGSYNESTSYALSGVNSSAETTISSPISSSHMSLFNCPPINNSLSTSISTGDASYNISNTNPVVDLSSQNLLGMPYNWPNNILAPKTKPRDFFCETIAVPNNSIVAQIVGKKGVKIKHLINQFDVNIQTPSPGQEPVFVIKGKRRNVYQAKAEITKASEHFSNIEKTRRDKLNSVMTNPDISSVQLFVPSRFVGMVVGRNGRFVRYLQMYYNVHIETPKYEQCKHFYIVGAEQNLQLVTRWIQQHLLAKSGIEFGVQYKNENEVHFFEKD